MDDAKLLVVDGNSLINRAYYAMRRPMITRDGIYTQGIFGFLNMLNRVLREYDPGFAAVAWDRKAPTFRHKAYDGYKAGRKKMPEELAMELPLMKEILTDLGIKNLEMDGFEADDIIGTVSRMGEEAGLSSLIVTGDRDALQLASDQTKILFTKKGISEFEIYDREKMLERYSLTPEQFIDLKGLMGDNSDNLPGIPGVGEKTGIKLLKQFGSLANLLSHTDEISAKGLREKVESNALLAEMSRKLAVICRTVPLDLEIEDLRRKEIDYDSLVTIYSKLEFNRFLEALHKEGEGASTLSASGVKEDGDTDQAENGVNAENLSEIRIDQEEQLKNLSCIPKEAEVGLLVFGNDDHVQMPSIEGIALLWENNFFYISEKAVQKEDTDLFSILRDLKPHWFGHNLISSYYSLMARGISEFTTAYDTKVAEYVLDPSASDYSLKLLLQKAFRQDIPTEKEFQKDISKTERAEDAENKKEQYAKTALLGSASLWRIQKEKLTKEELLPLCENLEFPLIEVLASMEHAGVTVDRNVLEEIGDDLLAQIHTLETRIYERAGETFNINSPKQLGTILFEKLGLPSGKKTKTGYSTSADILEKIKDKDPIVSMILEYRTVSKLRSTYVDGLIPLIGEDGKIHAHFQQTVAATGRLSCTEPNLQNIPVRTEIGRNLRKAFVAGEGASFVGADYSQIELRVLAHMSGDENLIQAFNEGQDIHRTTAARVFNKDYDAVTPLDRSRAKAVNFGVVYGMSSFGLSEEIHVSRKEAERYIKDYFSKHPKVQAFMDQAVKDCKEKGYSETILGRRRYIHEINSPNFMVRKLGERLA
ncbi:MAG: DNA polymerase I, partial [Eubacteriales bacterium]|nr:DNA polymerase I [Eubacteriales bacterium]